MGWTVMLGGGLFLITQASGGVPPATQPPMGAPLDGLTPDQMARFVAGAAAFDHNFIAPEGLGPVFNQNGCGSCHANPLGGPGSITVTRAGQAGKGGFDPLEQFGGSLFQQEAIDDACLEVVPVKANVVANRVTNGMLGYGLVEAIPDADILAVRDAQPPATQGAAHMVPAFEDPPASPLRVGRFGWKAQVPTILTFSADAALNEIGLTNRFLVDENDPNGVRPPDLIDCDAVPDPEDGPDAEGFDFIDRVTDFQRFLAAPPQTPKSGMTGEAIFMSIGCAVCHHPLFTTADDPALEDAIRNKPVQPYSDFLLHSMGLGADFIAQGDATELQLKTPPLMGVRTRDPLWHDGRVAGGTLADRIRSEVPGQEGVIFWHNQTGSQAAPAAQAFLSLTTAQQDAVIAFLDSLGRREFDHDGDGLVGLTDFIVFASCVGGGPYSPDDPCAISDIDVDGDVDPVDLDAFLTVYQGPMGDCNGNGVLDLVDIVLQTSQDANGNGIPDECEPTCPGDLNGTGTVDVLDLLGLLGQWGPCPAPPAPCGSDLDHNGTVDVLDLLALLTHWGACP